MSARPRPSLRDPVAAAAALRERVYATVTGLSTVLILLSQADSISPRAATIDLAVTMGGLWIASVFADVVAHSTVQGDAVRGDQLRSIMRVGAQAAEIAVVPLLAIGLSGTGWWTLHTGLVIAICALLLTQLVVALIALRLSTISTPRRLLIIAAELVLGGLVIAIKLAAH